MKRSKSAAAAAAILDVTQPVEASAIASNTIGVASGLSPRNVIDLSVECGLNHIVQTDGHEFARELDIAKAMTQEPEKFIANPLQLLLASSHAQVQSQFIHRCSAQDNKKHILAQFELYLTAVKGVRGVRDEAIMISDELYTNGAKNSGTLYDKNQPAQDVRPGWVEFVAAADQTRLILGCVDSYGALEITSITKRIQKCLQDGVAKSINQGQNGGAGIGSYMVFSAAISMYIAVKPGERTIVLCALPLGMRNKDVMCLTKNLHTLTLK